MMTMNRRKYRAGFTIAEAIVASMILAASVLVLCGICTRSLSSSRENRQRELAWDLLDRQLRLIDYTGIDEFIEQGIMEGQFKGDEEKYRWEVKITELEIDSLWKVDIKISWDQLARQKSVTATTMLNGQNAMVMTQR